MSRKQTSLSALAVLFSLGTATPVVAQSINNSAFPLPKTIPNGTVVRVNSSSSMMKINEALAQKFKSQFSGTNVKIAYDITDKALQALLDGKSDVAGIGRPLTDAEKAKGLVALPVTRNKIATIVGKDNALKKSLTSRQFAEIFRGEVTDWSKVGGSGGKIRFVDRPDSSDTRKAFQNYPVFKSADFKTGTTAVKLKQDSTNAVIKELGKNGIGYAIADQVVDNPSVRVISLHDVQPADPRYPFSQPLAYVYKGDKASPAVQAFLGIATAAENQQVVEKARTEIAKSASPLVPFTTPTATATQTKTTSTSNTNKKAATSVAPVAGNVTTTNTVVNSASDSEFPWWVLLIPALGGLLWWVMKGLVDETPTAIAPVVNPNAVAAKIPDSRIIFTPRDSRHGYAYWEIPEVTQENFRREGKRGLKLRLSDVTDIDMDLQPANSVQEFNCNEREPDLHFPIPADNREYIAEIGYSHNDEDWFRVARSQPVLVVAAHADANEVQTPSESDENIQATSLWGDKEITSTPVQTTSNANIAPAAAVTAGVAVGPTLFSFFSRKHQDKANNQQVENSQVILVPRSNDSAYAYWELSTARKAELEKAGGRGLALRLHETNDVDLDTSGLNLAEPIQEYECDRKNDLHIGIPKSNCNYLAELGYVKADGSWSKIARSEVVRVSSSMPASLDNLDDDTASPLPIEAEIAVSSNTRNTTSKTSDTIDDIQIQSTAINSTNGTNGTKTANGWMESAKSSFGTALAGGAAAVAEVGTATRTFFNKDSSPNANGNSQVSKAATTPQCRIILVPRNSQDAYAYWEISEEYKQVARDQGGRRFMLQIHDATNLDIDHQEPHATQEYFCYDSECDKHVDIPTCDRDYIAEIGYYTDDDRWIRIIRSLHVRVN